MARAASGDEAWAQPPVQGHPGQQRVSTCGGALSWAGGEGMGKTSLSGSDGRMGLVLGQKPRQLPGHRARAARPEGTPEIPTAYPQLHLPEGVLAHLETWARQRPGSLGACWAGALGAS